MCAVAEQLLDSLKEHVYHDSLAIIAFNLHITDTAYYNLRNRLYSNPEHPRLFCDGTSAGDTNQYVSSINAARSVPPRFNLALEAQATATDGSIRLSVITADSFMTVDSFETADSVYAFIAVCQDSALYINPINDSSYYDFTCRKLFYFPIALPYPDSLDTTITFSHSYPVDKLRAVAFIQTLVSASKKVHQAATVPFVSPLP